MAQRAPRARLDLLMGRPPGSKNYKSKSVRLLLGRLENEGRLTPTRILERLQEIALSDALDRVTAARLLLGYFYGYPQARLELEHGISESFVDVLLRIHNSDEHRHNLEDLERRRSRALTTSLVTSDETEKAS